MANKAQEKEKLKVKAAIKKAKKPFFVRRKAWAISRFGKQRRKKLRWVRPRGMHAKIRLKRKGYPRRPSIGWAMPRAIKGLVKGLRPVVIHNAAELAKLQKDEIGVVASGVGLRGKAAISEKALQLKTKLANLDPEQFLAQLKKKEEEKKKAKGEEKKVKEKPAEKSAEKGKEKSEGEKK